MSDYLLRLAQEEFEVSDRLEILTRFRNSPDFLELPWEDQSLLHRQYHAMGWYRGILRERLQRGRQEEQAMPGAQRASPSSAGRITAHSKAVIQALAQIAENPPEDILQAAYEQAR